MAYIIENADLLKKDGVERTSLLINGGRIQSIRPTFKRFTYMRMNASPYVMTSTHIILDKEVPFNDSFSRIREYYENTFLRKGCTTFLTYTEVDKEYLLKPKLQEKKKNLLNSPIDFIIGVKIPLRLLTPSFIRMCKKERIPILFVELEDRDTLENVPWGWVREAMFPYNSPLAPLFKQTTAKLRKQAHAKWIEILTKEKIPFIEKEIEEKIPLSHSTLCKIGVYPIKSNVHQGAEVSYNFYLKEDEANMIEESDLFLYHSHRLMITVHKGMVIRAGDDIMFRPGFGEQVVINTPSFYSGS